MLDEEIGKEDGTELRLPTVPQRDVFHVPKTFLEKGPLKSSSGHWGTIRLV